jgi:hypothetical protein
MAPHATRYLRLSRAADDLGETGPVVTRPTPVTRVISGGRIISV